MTNKQLTAFQLKLEGYSYAKISITTGFSEFTLRKYFAKGGRWHESYNTWKKLELPIMQNTVREVFKAHALAAAQHMVKALESPNPVTAFRAAQDILDRAGFAKNSDGFTVAGHSDPAESVAKWFEKYKKDENEKHTSARTTGN